MWSAAGERLLVSRTAGRGTPEGQLWLWIVNLWQVLWCEGRWSRDSSAGGVLLKWERPYQHDSTASRLLSEVKHVRAWLVLRWGTTLESQVLFSFCNFDFRKHRKINLITIVIGHNQHTHTAHSPLTSALFWYGSKRGQTGPKWARWTRHSCITIISAISDVRHVEDSSLGRLRPTYVKLVKLVAHMISQGSRSERHGRLKGGLGADVPIWGHFLGAKYLT